MTQRIRIGFVGVGSMGQAAHLRNYAALADCEVVAIAELRPHLAQAVARRYGVPRVYADAGAMLASERLDAVVAIQQFTRHGLVLPQLYAAGLPVLSEKPLAASLPVAERLLGDLRAGGSWHMVGYHKRCDPATVWAKGEIDRLLASGEAGRLRYVRITMPVGDWVAGGFDELVRTDEPVPDEAADPPDPALTPEQAAEYERFVNYYIHQVNLLRFLLGEPYRVTFADRAGLLLVAESAGGVTATIEMNPYATTVGWHESALVAFERGYVRVDLPAPLAQSRPGRVEVLLDPGGGREPAAVSPQLPWVHAMRAQAAAFVRAVRGEAPPPCEAAEAYEDLRIADDYLRMWRAAQVAKG